MQLSIYIKNVQHVKYLSAHFNLSDCTLTCIAGKNGCGKTTLIRALQNIRASNVFMRTASPYIFCESSEIKYFLDDKAYFYKYNSKIKQIDSRSAFPKEIKELMYVEMPIPYGIRFSRFSNLAGIDEDLRKKIALKEYSFPIDLQRFLFNVYQSSKFDGLREVKIKGESYYFLLKDEGFYIREDYFSSGEYFLINLYRLVSQKKRLIAIDELDISLDAAAQVRLVGELRRFCQECRLNIIFTTHSLPMMKTLNGGELYYMECVNEEVSISRLSYNFVKSILFGFVGWDRYILVEDKVSQRFLEYILRVDNVSYFYKYRIIYVGGADQVIDLMKRNKQLKFFSEGENVIAVLDGDQSGKESYRERKDTFFLPVSNVEDGVYEYYLSGALILEREIEVPMDTKKPGKSFYRKLLGGRSMSETDIFKFLYKKSQNEADKLLRQLVNFLNG